MPYLQLVITFFLLSISPLSAQNVIVSEVATETYYHYFQQLKYIEQSLLKGSQHPKLEWSEKATISEQRFRTLCDQFTKKLPKDFYESPGGVPVLNTETKKGQADFIRYTYTQIRNNQVVGFVQLTVFYDVSRIGEAIKHPKILNIEVNSDAIAVPMQNDEISKKYKEAMAKAASLPPLPPIDN